MSTTKPNLVAPLAFAVLGVTAALIEPALAEISFPGETLLTISAVPAPIIGAGLPVLAVFGGGYWLIGKLRQRR